MAFQTTVLLPDTSIAPWANSTKLSFVASSLELSPRAATAQSLHKEYAVANRYRARNGMKSLQAIISNYLIVLVCILLDRVSSQSFRNQRLLPAIVYLCCAMIIASRLRAFENLVHEASHNNLFVSPPLHERLEFLYAFPVFRLVGEYRSSHMIHHKHLGDPKKDPDVLRIYGLGLDQLPEHPVWLLFGVPLTGFCTYEWLSTTFLEFWGSSSSLLSKTAYWLIITITIFHNDMYHAFAYYYLAPLLVVLPVTRYWAEASEHLGMDLTSVFGHSRTNIGLLHRLYMHPHNDGYHAVHHLHSQVPFHALPEAHESLMQESLDFRTSTVISYGIIETFKQMVGANTVWKHGG